MNQVVPRRWKRLPSGARLYSEVRAPWVNAETGRMGVATRFGRSRNAANKGGERVVAIRWDDTGLVTLTHCRGNNTRTEYVEWHKATYDMDDMDVEAWALERLTNREPVMAWCGRCGRPMQAEDAMCCPGVVE